MQTIKETTTGREMGKKGREARRGVGFSDRMAVNWCPVWSEDVRLSLNDVNVFVAMRRRAGRDAFHASSSDEMKVRRVAALYIMQFREPPKPWLP